MNTETVARVKDKHQQDLKRLLNYQRVLIETVAYAKKEIVHTDALLRLLAKFELENFEQKSLDQFCRENFGFNGDRFNRILRNGTTLTEEEFQNVVLYLNKI